MILLIMITDQVCNIFCQSKQAQNLNIAALASTLRNRAEIFGQIASQVLGMTRIRGSARVLFKNNTKLINLLWIFQQAVFSTLTFRNECSKSLDILLLIFDFDQSSRVSIFFHTNIYFNYCSCQPVASSDISL